MRVDARRCRALRTLGTQGLLGLALGALLPLLGPSAAAARTETIRWRYEAPDRVAGFRIHVGSRSGKYEEVIDAGKPAPNAGVYAHEIEVGDGATVFVAISAYKGSEASELSNQVKHKPSGASRPPPEPPEDSDGLVERFGSYDLGDDPTGWLDTGPGASRGSDDALFSIGRVKGNRALETTSTLANIHSHYVTPESPGWSRYEFRGRMRIDDPDGGVGVTVLSQFPDRDAYYRIRRSAGAASEQFQMSPRPEGYAIRCESASTGIKARAKRWYRFRVQVSAEDGETLIRAKVWRGVHAEPRAWQVECADDSPTRLTRGVPGVWSMGPGGKQWDDLKVIPLEAGVVESGGRRTRPPNAPGKPVLIDGN